MEKTMEIEWIEDYIKAQHLALESIDRIRVKEVIDVLSQANATGKKYLCVETAATQPTRHTLRLISEKMPQPPCQNRFV